MDDIRTIFVSGLPEDVTERELYLLFRPLSGYLGCTMQQNKKGPPVCFAMFDSKMQALHAMEGLKDVRFDPESTVTLRVELAKQNSYPKRSRATDDSEAAPSKFFRRDAYPAQQGGFLPSMPPAAYSLPPVPMYGHEQYYPYAPAAAPYAAPGAPAAHDLGYYPPPALFGAPSHDPYPAKPNACSTLFLSGLTSETTEQSLTKTFSDIPGFVRIKMGRETAGKPPVAWAEFADAKFSSVVLETIGSIAPGIRAEFAKSKMGARKDA